MRRTAELFLFFVIAFWFPNTAEAAKNARRYDEGLRILIINSYHSEYGWTRDQIEGFVSEIHKRYPDAQIFTEFLDAKRVVSTSYFRSYAKFLADKYNGKTFSLVYATDDIALEFAQSFSEKVWDHDTPIVASGINHIQSFGIEQHPLTRGILETQSGGPLIKEALKQNPGAKRIVIVADATEVGYDIADEIGVQTKDLCDLPVVRNPAMSFESLVDYVGQFDRDTIFLLAQYAVDGKGRYIDPLVVAKGLSLHARGPMYIFNEMYAGEDNIVGGLINVGKEHGRAAAKIAVEILEGTKFETIPAYSIQPHEWVFNYKALARFGISPGILPSDALLHGRPTNFILDHILLFTLILLWIVAQTLLIVYLLLNIRKRRHVTQKLERSDAQLRWLIDESPLAIFISDEEDNIMLLNGRFRALFGYGIGELKTVDRLKELLLPDPAYREKVLEMIYDNVRSAEATETAPLPVEFEALTKEGRKVEVEIYFAKAGNLHFRVLHDVTQRNRMIRELKAATTAARAANDAKSMFLANVSHEIRTPMNGIMGMMQLLRETSLTQDQKECLDTMRDSCNLLATVINDILDFSKIEAGQMTIDPEPLKLRPFIRSVAGMVGPSIESRGLEFICEIDEQLPDTVKCDPNRLKQILLNLLNNATKFTERGQIEMRVKGSGGIGGDCTLHFDIIDTGIGIASEKQGQIFEPFIQVDSTLTRKHGGTGLGLVICRRLVQMMGGYITLVSEQGKGSKFGFDIVVPVLPPMEVRTVAEEPINSEIGRMHPLKIMIAEDNPVNQKVVVALLRKMGYAAEIAVDGREAFEKVQRTHFDVILMDIQMPVMDGYVATTKIRETLPADSQPRIIALTAHALSEDVRRCLDAGMNAHLTKPIRAAHLKNALVESYDDIFSHAGRRA